MWFGADFQSFKWYSNVDYWATVIKYQLKLLSRTSAVNNYYRKTSRDLIALKYSSRYNSSISVSCH